ncbi:GNAT family N-acetyltransferase [Uliginosibacterium sp. H3]|uniref:GNAT family N-acetyltransferase n=1 Tax=Uliginosibacterium silvisoli TaxID=3114758 RepID=A0ABU6JYJ7_9RHOO|nr:GNAT family N-acetyltransferase [Uliginosibacterium sp. H3]
MSDAVLIRAASLDDAKLYESFMTDIFAENLDTLCPRAQSPTLEQVRSWMATHTGESSIIFVAESRGDLVGTINLTRFGRPHVNHAIGLGLNVRHGQRNKGIGKALLQAALSWFDTVSVLERIELEVISNNAPAIHLYEAFGFEREGVKRKAVKKGALYFDLHIMSIQKASRHPLP